MSRLDVVGVGNALVDVLALVPEEFLVEHGLAKGTMALVDADRAIALYDAMPPATEVSGGSAANTVAGVARLGGRSGFIGRVADDQLGAVFAHDIRAAGVEFVAVPPPDGPPTGRCLIAVTPDAQRTMSTLLGASTELGPDDVDEAFVADAAICYLEGYLVEQRRAREAFEKAAAASRDGGGRVALTLSDSLCVHRAREQFRELVAGSIDILFGNEDELRLLYETDRLEEAIDEASSSCSLVVVTRGPAGAVVAAGAERHVTPAETVEEVVDTTGAGDLFAAGFLHGLTTGRDLTRCARLGAVAAAEVISHLGARPEVDLRDLIRQIGV